MPSAQLGRGSLLYILCASKWDILGHFVAGGGCGSRAAEGGRPPICIFPPVDGGEEGGEEDGGRGREGGRGTLHPFGASVVRTG